MTLTIRRRLAIQTALSVLVLLVTVLSVVWVSVTAARSMENANLLSEIGKGVFELHDVANEYLLHPGEQPVRQWHAKHEALSALLSGLKPGDRESAELLDGIVRTHLDIKALYEKITENEERRVVDSGTRTVYHDLLVGQLVAHEHSMVLATDQLKRLNRSPLLDAYKANSLVLVILVTVLASAVSGTSWFLGRHVIRSLDRLREGAGIIAGGNLEHRMDVATRDEIGALAGAFDRMAESLAAAREELNREVAEHRRAAEALRETTRTLRGLIESAPLGIISFDAGGRVTLWNPAAEKLFGWTEAEALGRPLPTVPDDRLEEFRELQRHCLAGEPILEVELRRKRKDGTPVDVVLSTAPLRDAGGTVRGTMGIFLDITQVKELERIAVVQQKMASLGHLAAGIAHEIRNPLSGLNLYMSAMERLLSETEPLDPETRESAFAILGMTKTASGKIEAVVRKVLDFARPTLPRIGFLSANICVRKAIDLAQVALRRSGIQLDVSLREDLPPCRGDARLLEQAFLNLLTNAAQALEGRAGEKAIEVASFQENGYIHFAVADSGPGVPPHLRERIFDPFFTTRTGGTGIGLSITHKIVSDHGGFIKVGASRFGGALFTIGLPTCE